MAFYKSMVVDFNEPVAPSSGDEASVLISGAYKTMSELSVLISGAWKDVEELHVLISGEWKLVKSFV